jgi:branched-chain amino acid transport system permease protein
MASCGDFKITYGQDIALLKGKLQWIGTVILVLIAAVLPLVAGNGQLINFLNWVIVTYIMALGLQIVTGYCGQLSMCQSGFMGIGAYTSAILTTKLGLSFWLALPLAGVGAGIVGLILGLPSARLKGFYLAVVTLSAQFIIPWIIIHLPKTLTGGPYGMEAETPKIGGLSFITPEDFYPIMVVFGTLMTLIAINLTRTRYGRAFVAIRDNEIAAEVMGINVNYYKLMAFFVSAFFAGIAGSLWAHNMKVIYPEFYNLTQSVWILGILVIGGLGSIPGAMMGTIFVRGIEELVNTFTPSLAKAFLPGVSGAQFFAGLLMIVFGGLIAWFLIFEPRGLSHRWQTFRSYWRMWPFSY